MELSDHRCIFTMIYPTDPFGNKLGGVETFLKGFIKFAPDLYKINFIGITSDPYLELKKWHHVQIQGREVSFFPVLYLKNENIKTRIPLSLKFVFRLAMCNICVENSVLVFQRLEPSILFSIKRFPKIIFIHNDLKKQILSPDSEVLWRKFPWLYFFFEKLVFKNTNFISTVSQSTLDLYYEKYAFFRDKFSFVPTWVDTEIFNCSSKSKLSVRENIFPNDFKDKKIVLFVGRLQTQKAPVRLIESFFHLVEKVSDARMVIVGEGNLKGIMEEHIQKLKLEGKILLVGNVNQTSLANYYHAADVLLLASNFEGMPICVLEALACGIPVVSTQVGEVKRVVKNGCSGEVVESFEPDHIALALKKVTDSPQIYTKENCINSVADYIPRKVLTPVYDRIRELYEGYYGK